MSGESGAATHHEDLIPDAHVYIGEDVCEKPWCNRKKEFPEGSDTYCIHHSLEEWHKERDSA